MKNIFFLLVGMSLAVVKERRKRTYMKCFLQQLPYDIALQELFDTGRNSGNINYAHVSDVQFFAWFEHLIVRRNAVLNSLKYENVMFLKFENLLNSYLKALFCIKYCVVCVNKTLYSIVTYQNIKYKDRYSNHRL